MKTQTKFLLTFMLMVANISMATSSNFNISRSITVETIPMNHELAQKVTPIIRTFIARNGHVAYVKDTNFLVVADSPLMLPKVKSILSSLTPENFDEKKFRNEIATTLIQRHKKNQITRLISVKHTKAKYLIPALSGLTSNDGGMELVANTNQIRVTDFPDYVSGMENLIESLDKE